MSNRTPFITDEAMQRSDVAALKKQLEQLEADDFRRRINARADEIADELRAKIAKFGAVPCVLGDLKNGAETMLGRDYAEAQLVLKKKDTP